MLKRKGFLLWLLIFTLTVFIIGSNQFLYLGFFLYIISILIIVKFNIRFVNKKIVFKPLNISVIIFVIFSSKLSMYLSKYLTEFFNLHQYNSTMIWMLCWYSLSIVSLFLVWNKSTIKEQKIELV